MFLTTFFVKNDEKCCVFIGFFPQKPIKTQVFDYFFVKNDEKCGVL